MVFIINLEADTKFIGTGSNIDPCIVVLIYNLSFLKNMLYLIGNIY
ncbi:MAG TPA: hypothetical protein IAB49_03480 [Candidatus Caccenecus avistercoris]|nr:hypothetical protein [Candidatus Caccenecus avistercoris]